jgi:hypothetical protein
MTDPTPDRSTRRQAASRRRRILVGALAVVVVAAIVVGVVLVAGGSDSDDDSATGTTARGTGSELTTVAPTTNAAKPLEGGICSGDQLIGEQVSSGLSGTTQIGVFAFTNQSKTSCTVNGSVTVQLLDDDGKDLPTTVTTGGGAVPADLAAAEVTIEPGGQASVVMSWAPVAGPNDTAGCSEAKAMDVVMPESKGAIKLDVRMNVCAGGALNISPVQPGVATA